MTKPRQPFNQADNWKTEPADDDSDELPDQDADKDLVSPDSDDFEFDDPWETEPGSIPNIHLKRLDEIIVIGYPGDPHDKSRTGGVICPKALDLAWRALKRSGGKWTKARVQRMSLYHGLRIAYMDSEIKAIWRVYNRLMKISQAIDDDDLIDVLSERKTYGFRDPSPKTTSMGALAFLEGAIADLADCLGIAKSNMYILLSLTSIVTYQPRMWSVNLDKEYRSFRNAIKERKMKLESEYERITAITNKQQDGKTVKRKDD
jgi:hypothetical protein